MARALQEQRASVNMNTCTFSSEVRPACNGRFTSLFAIARSVSSAAAGGPGPLAPRLFRAMRSSIFSLGVALVAPAARTRGELASM